MEGNDRVRDFIFKQKVVAHATIGLLPCAPLNNRHFRCVLDVLRPVTNVSYVKDVRASEPHRRSCDKLTKDRSLSVGQPLWVMDTVRKGRRKPGMVIEKLGASVDAVKGSLSRSHKDSV